MTSDRASRLAWLNQPTRLRALEAAEAVFAQAGIEGATMDAIAKYANISRSHLYYHFKSKQELLDGLVDVRLAEFLADQERLRSSLSGEPRRTLMAAIVTTVLPKHRDFIRLILAEALHDQQQWDAGRRVIDTVLVEVAHQFPIGEFPESVRSQLTWFVALPLVLHNVLTDPSQPLSPELLELADRITNDILLQANGPAKATTRSPGSSPALLTTTSGAAEMVVSSVHGVGDGGFVGDIQREGQHPVAVGVNEGGKGFEVACGGRHAVAAVEGGFGPLAAEARGGVDDEPGLLMEYAFSFAGVSRSGTPPTAAR